ncbi:MAG TPA: M20/M25/M40 family metallo-hydrolase [Streptosporangiaceae bacterium]|nr:M20/M25/M40 family metallo-hydrolase [Streptosporangiaceae bacterium]
MTENQKPENQAVTAAADEVVGICRDLIRIDTTNPGDHSGPGERVAAEYVAGLLDEVGLESQIFESHPKRASLVARIAGEDSSRPALLMHGHLDVVPANAADWKVDPFSGEVVDGCVWGRGAVDMKDMDAMILAVIRQRLREGRRPPRDVVLAFTADEEAGSTWGAHYLVDQHPELFEGVTEAIGEVGGYSVTVNDQRLYLLQTAERGIAWMRLTAQGTAGHGAMVHPDNAVTELAEAVARIGRHEWPVQLTPPVLAFLEAAADVLGIEFDPDDPDAVLNRIGPISRIIRAVTRNTVNPTRLRAGYKVNVIPQEAVAEIDGRYLPGHEDEFFAELDRLIGPQLARDVIHRDIAVEAPAEGALYQAMTDALVAADPGARVVPYTMFGGTDAKAFSLQGIKCYGYAPLQLPADLDFSGMFHGVDERVPVDGLRFGTRVLDAFLDHC